MKFVVGINNKEIWRLEYVLSCAWRLSHQFQVLFRATSSVLIGMIVDIKMTQQLLSINIKLVLVLNIKVRNIVHFLCVWSLMYPTRVLSSYLMCFSSLSSASLKFNSSIQVFPETLFLVTVVSFKNTCWFCASNSQWPFFLYSSPAPFKPAESFSLVTSHFIFLLLLHFKCKLNRRRRWRRVANIWRQKLLVSCLSQAVWYVISTLPLWILLSSHKN